MAAALSSSSVRRLWPNWLVVVIANWTLLLLLLLPNSLSSSIVVHALYQDEAGAADVRWHTAGHGRVRAAAVVDQVLVTIGGIDNTKEETAMNNTMKNTYIAGRHWLTGELLWRRELQGTAPAVYVAPSSSGMILVSSSSQPTAAGPQLLWGLAPTSGALVWEQRISSSSATPLSLKLVGDDLVQVMGGESVVLDIASGRIVPPNDLKKKSDAIVLEKMARGSTDPIICQSREFAIDEPSGTIRAGGGTETDANELWLLKCDESGIVILSSSVRGTTAVFQYGTSRDNSKDGVVLWTAQEGLAGASTAILVNADPAWPAEASSKLLNSLQERLLSQYQSFSSQWLATSSRDHWKNHLFGWHKIALLLNADHHRLFGLDSLTGKISYQIDLLLHSDWHKIVDHPDEHHQVLILSSILQGKELHCTCLDASTGTIQSESTLALSAGLQQIIPVRNTIIRAAADGTTHNNNNKSSCDVGAVLVLDDGSVLVTDPVRTGIPENLYSHLAVVSNDASSSSSVVRTYRIPSSRGVAQLVGTTHFPGETIVGKAYPNRHEVTESPCNVLGDNSLLLKYLNPHIMVVLTATTAATGQGGDNDNKPILLPKKNRPPAKRKPAGVEGTTTAALSADTTTTSQNNLFVNVVDTVSGKLLYRIGHAHADASSARAILSEHWVIYTFINTKTKKAEMGVLSLYEGMIEKNGLTAFTSPARSNNDHIHSSLDATAPVVLAKTYVLPSAPTALGMTVTRAGISARRVLLATRDGRVHGLDRYILEPRRPVGPVNDNEKKEGLVQYHEMIMLVPPMTLSYNLTIEGVTRIASAPTHLESQTVVLAYGGPDLFLTRTSPSKGFDVLPESFSRPLILLVLAILAGTLIFLQSLVDKKVVQQGWV